METKKTIDDTFVYALENYKSGENSAFSYIYEHSCRQLEKYALYLTGNREDAEDLLQETYLRMIEKSRTIRENMAFMSWARTIMYNLFITKCRKDAKVFPCEDDALYAFLDDEKTGEDPADAAVRGEMNAIVDKAVDSLSAIQQEVIHDYYYNEKPVKKQHY